MISATIYEFSQLWYYVTAFMLIDVFLGMFLAGTKGIIDADTCFYGVGKKIGILLVLIFAVIFEHAIQVPIFKLSAIFYMTYEAVSIIENAGLLGIPLPKVLRQAVEALKKNTDESDDKTKPN